jgi:septal ring factor EnvC (AmiA/AmiB activator)
VEGAEIYAFGRLRNPNNTTLRWDGIGIAAPVGTPVKAVAGGKVVVAGPIPGGVSFGKCVILEHGADLSVYCSLSTVSVRMGQIVQQGDPIGLVGISDADLGPHLHFEIRPGGLKAVDPVAWLRARQ